MTQRFEDVDGWHVAFDPQADAFLIRKTGIVGVHDTVDDDGLIIRIDESGHPVGFEALSASTRGFSHYSALPPELVTVMKRLIAQSDH